MPARVVFILARTPDIAAAPAAVATVAPILVGVLAARDPCEVLEGVLYSEDFFIDIVLWCALSPYKYEDDDDDDDDDDNDDDDDDEDLGLVGEASREGMDGTGLPLFAYFNK
jgi:hypothetical protein